MSTQEQSTAFMGLRFAGVKGTTAQTSAQFTVQNEKIAYVAGSGVIVATIEKDGQLRHQRLFVANSVHDASPANYGYGYLKTQENDEDLRKDMYGFPVNSTHYYRGTAADSESASTASFENREVSGTSSKLKDKVRAPTCLAISPNGRVLAVGESGYQPRILLYSLAPDSAAQPFAVIHEHSFGINHIMFSPNSKYFCSLGTSTDGFLHVWKYSPTSVMRKAGNKCSYTVNDLLWHDTGSEFGEIITLGLRFLKVWQIDSKEAISPSKVAVLRGRNIILGELLESNFQCAIPLNPEEIIVREHRSFYLLSLKNEPPLQQIALDHEKISGLVADNTENALWVFDEAFESSILKLQQLDFLPEPEPQAKGLTSPSKVALGIQKLSMTQKRAILRAHNCGNNHIVYLTSDGEIYLHNKETKASTQFILPPMSAVAAAKRASTGEILVFSKHGKVASLTDFETVTDLVSHSLPQAESIVNELTAAEKTTSTLFLGDRYGSLTVFDLREPTPRTELVIKAHTSAINDIIHFEVEGVPLLCSISRDRMIQIYRKNTQWDVLCTLPLHTANLLSVKFDSSHLFVCSADRSISVHEIFKNSTSDGSEPVEIRLKKTITLKNTPLAMDVSDSDFVVSSSDRNLYVYDKLTLEYKRAVKLYSEKSTEASCVDKFLLMKNHLIAVFCSDRSLRLFDLLPGKHLACTWGHLESVIGLFESDDHLLSLGADGCLFKWKIVNTESESPAGTQQIESKPASPDTDVSPLFAKVTRKFLPTVQMPKLALSPKRTSSLAVEDTGFAEPESPTPRLTNATLKRMEARKRAQETASSPPRLPRTQTAIVGKSPFRSKSASPPKNNPSVSQSSFDRTPNKKSTMSRSLHVASKTQNSISPSKGTALSLPPPVTTSGDANERATAYLAMIKSFIKKDAFTHDEKLTLKNDLEELLSLLGGPKTYEDLLERYSESLVSLVEKKISDDKTN